MRDLSLEDQKKILTKYSLLDKCDSVRKSDSIHIVDLRADKVSLQVDNLNLAETIRRRKKIPFIVGVGAFFVGIITRNQFK